MNIDDLTDASPACAASEASVAEPLPTPPIEEAAEVPVENRPTPKRKYERHGIGNPSWEIGRENYKHTAAIKMLAAGCTGKEVAQATNMHPSTVINLSKQGWANERINEFQEKNGGEEVARIFREASVKAAKCLDKIVSCDDIDDKGKPVMPPAAQVAAAAQILDRFYGKAKEPMDSNGLAKLDFDKMSDSELIQHYAKGRN